MSQLSNGEILLIACCYKFHFAKFQFYSLEYAFHQPFQEPAIHWMEISGTQLKMIYG